MKIVCQNHIAGEGSLLEQFQRLQQWGFEGAEIVAWEKSDGCRSKGLLRMESEIKAAMDRTGLPVTSICGGIHFEFLDADPAKRAADIERLKNALRLAGRLGANGVIMVPAFHPHFHGVTLPPDLSPWKTSVELQKELLAVQLKEAAPVAEEAGASIILEPLNRYEAPWFNRLEHGAEICERIHSKAVGFMADFFHMNIEETNPAAAIQKHRRWINHVHLADNTRKQPGTGSTDFKAGFAALKKIGFKGAMALECGIDGKRDKALAECVAFLKKCRG
ncbi:MAG: sugar phosphate isomerase/epimerase [Verrucomicrobia bacterium]|nr:sugar phosphate isomerase/epimerase [Verrucomicrobiota bacterium]